MNSREGAVVLQVREGLAAEDHGALAGANDSQTAPLMLADGAKGAKPGFAMTSKMLEAVEGDTKLCSDLVRIIVLLRVQQLCILVLLVYGILCMSGRFFPEVAQLIGDAPQLILSPTTFLQVFVGLFLISARFRIRAFARKVGSDERWAQPLAGLLKFWRFMVAAYCSLCVTALASITLSPQRGLQDSAAAGHALYYLPGQ
eukprot:TRINITY_DN625_c0_g1_i1.p1 TRINITY_DN625_c0_g1~~TRINITY_DN625_c0_g1_i1.p1  ORF type:complete len:201 (-),score=29.22 TRINITY_DN625_c0_g1_i1:330-932(-)